MQIASKQQRRPSAFNSVSYLSYYLFYGVAFPPDDGSDVHTQAVKSLPSLFFVLFTDFGHLSQRGVSVCFLSVGTLGKNKSKVLFLDD